MSNQLIITKEENKILSSFFQEKELVQINCEDSVDSNILGNIYLCKVKNIVKNINAAFVEIADGKMCYLPLGEKETPIFANVKKNDKIQIGDEILVQVTKEAVKTKAPFVSCNLNFTGKYIVITHGKTMIGISSKLKDSKEREHLKRIVSQFANEKYGYIIRTNAVNAREEEIVQEIKQLSQIYERVKKTGVHKVCFSLIQKAPAGFLCDIRDGNIEAIDEIITDDRTLYEEIFAYLSENQKEDIEKLHFYEDTMISLNHLYSIKTKLEKALQERVWLKSGGYLVIQPTEALTVIDVNTGKAISGRKKAEETFFKINLEAAAEIAKQLRLRNLSGIIIIDFIDLVSQEHKKTLIKHLTDFIQQDPIKTNFIDMTALNLVEITRKKVRKPLHEQFGIERLNF